MKYEPIAAGQRFGRLLVVEKTGDSKRRKGFIWLCRCDCGNTKLIVSGYLRTTRSCGCLARELSRKRAKHGQWRTKVYQAWSAMLRRCNNPKTAHFSRYGGRGIKVCERWQNSFVNFLEDMGQPPSAEHSIDRINGDGDYEPGNCRWATRKEQAQNNKRIKLIEYRGRTLGISDWATVLGVRRATLHNRLKRMSVAEAFSCPPNQPRSGRKAFVLRAATLARTA